jgi:hypothetical protein
VNATVPTDHLPQFVVFCTAASGQQSRAVKLQKGMASAIPLFFCGMFDPSKSILIEKISRMVAS